MAEPDSYLSEITIDDGLVQYIAASMSGITLTAWLKKQHLPTQIKQTRLIVDTLTHQRGPKIDPPTIRQITRLVHKLTREQWNELPEKERENLVTQTAEILHYKRAYFAMKTLK